MCAFAANSIFPFVILCLSVIDIGFTTKLANTSIPIKSKMATPIFKKN